MSMDIATSMKSMTMSITTITRTTIMSIIMTTGTAAGTIITATRDIIMQMRSSQAGDARRSALTQESRSLRS